MTDEYEVLIALYERMPAQRKREFWQLQSTPGAKMAYLFRHGGMVHQNGRAA